MPKNGTRKSIDRAQEIYLTAAQMFVEKGVESTSLTDIGNALSITKAGLYYYFESKQELLYRIVELGLDNVQKEVLNPARAIENAEARLKFIIYNHARLAAEGNHAVIIVSHEMNSLSFAQRESVLSRRREYFDFVRDTLIEIQSSAKLNNIDMTTATFTLFGMILWLSRWYRANGKLSVEEVCENVCAMALNGLLRD